MTKEKTTITRKCAGCYTISRGRYEVEVVQHDEFNGPDKWIARALWDRGRYTDLLPTYRDAKKSAILMLDTADDPAYRF
jgi:hypothetical protein